MRNSFPARSTRDSTRDSTRVLKRNSKRDALLQFAWRSCVLAMIIVAGLLCLTLSYRAAFALIAGAWSNSMTLAIVSILAGVGVRWLCENRSDLVEA